MRKTQKILARLRKLCNNPSLRLKKLEVSAQMNAMQVVCVADSGPKTDSLLVFLVLRIASSGASWEY